MRHEGQCDRCHARWMAMNSCRPNVSRRTVKACIRPVFCQEQVTESFLNSDYGKIPRALAVFENRLNPAILDRVMFT